MIQLFPVELEFTATHELFSLFKDHKLFVNENFVSCSWIPKCTRNHLITCKKRIYSVLTKKVDLNDIVYANVLNNWSIMLQKGRYAQRFPLIVRCWYRQETNPYKGLSYILITEEKYPFDIDKSEIDKSICFKGLKKTISRITDMRQPYLLRLLFRFKQPDLLLTKPLELTTSPWEPLNHTSPNLLLGSGYFPDPLQISKVFFRFLNLVILKGLKINDLSPFFSPFLNFVKK